MPHALSSILVIGFQVLDVVLNQAVCAINVANVAIVFVDETCVLRKQGGSVWVTTKRAKGPVQTGRRKLDVRSIANFLSIHCLYSWSVLYDSKL